MIMVYMLRHGQTRWNIDKKIQGHTDIPLLSDTVESLGSINLSPEYKAVSWYSSPLSRTRQTAKALGLEPIAVAELIEMNWGRWEGKTLAELRQQQRETMQIEEARGIDMTPTDGESPRQVAVRLDKWLTDLNPQSAIGVVTHKGVIRAALTLACNWDMKDKPPVKIDWNNIVGFSWSSEAGLQLVSVNLPLSQAD